MPDFRLLLFASTLWIGAATTGLIPAPFSYLLVFSLIFIATIKKNLLIIIAIGLLAGSAGYSLRIASNHASEITNLSKTRTDISFQATVISDPHWSTAKVVGSRIRASNWEFLATVNQINSQRVRTPVLIISPKQYPLELGLSFSGEATVLPSTKGRAAGLLLIRGELTPRRRAPPIISFANSIRRNFHNQALRIGGESGALIPGLVIGDTSLESQSFISSMRRVGLTHLTAVSGENFAIVSAFLMWLFQWLLPKRRWRILGTSFVLLLFIFLVRPSPSVLRATVMTAVLLISKFRGVRTNPLAALGAAITLLILIDPYQAVDPGFALSVAATAGILIAQKPLSKFLPDLLAIPISATLFCTPFIVAISGQFSLISILANILASVAVAPITILGFIAALAPPIIQNIAHLLLVLVNPCSQWIVLIARIGAKVPVLLLPKSWLGAAFVLLLMTLLLRRKWVIIATVLSIYLITSILSDGAWPGSNWAVVNCDVGQGDGLAINLGANSAIVIDAGPDPVLIDSCLSALNIKRIPLLVLTHFHADHISGVSGVLHGRTVNQVWITNSQEPATEYERTMKLISAYKAHIAAQGEETTFNSARGEVRIKVLWPKSEQTRFASLPGDGSAINNSSVALDITIGSLRIFDGGDIEPPAQAEILTSAAVRPVDILKVSHHGSAYQDWALLDALKPSIALISVGAGNSYGHPAPTTLHQLAARGAKTFRTDLDGAIAVDSTLRIRTKKRARWKISWG